MSCLDNSVDSKPVTGGCGYDHAAGSFTICSLVENAFHKPFAFIFLALVKTSDEESQIQLGGES
jgi:hypothetical protein